ncbi:MAG: AAA family ATPase, partial [Pseudomonadota bacterium]
SRWPCRVPRLPRKVLVLDGEMPGSDVKERYLKEKQRVGVDVLDKNLRWLLFQEQTESLPNLSTPEGKALVESALGDAEVLFLDNKSTLFNGDERDECAWQVNQDWLLSLRRRGISVILVHHSGKGGQQRGTSKLEDPFDVSILLQRPEHYDPSEGARFEVRYEKARGFFGEDAEPFEAQYSEENGAAVWTHRPCYEVNEGLVDKCIELNASGLSLREIAKEVGKSKTWVGDRLKERRDAS